MGLDRFQPWSPRQRSTLAVVVLLFLVVLAVLRFLRPFRYGEPPMGDAPHAGQLATKIDPNTADAAALAALPLIGPSRAQEIIDYRDRWQSDHPDQPAFTTPDDLLNVKGIGRSTLETLRPYLHFPTGEPLPPPPVQPPVLPGQIS